MKPTKEKRPPKPKPQFTIETLPYLLSTQHVMYIMSCCRPKAEEIMNQPHRPLWQQEKGGIKRLHKDIFLEQLKQECKMIVAS